MYTKGGLVEDFTSGNMYCREILDPNGDVICYVPETSTEDEYNKGNTQADILLTHLNR